MIALGAAEARRYAARLEMPDEFKSTWWSIQLANGWHSEQDDLCATFWRDNGVGALQISARSHDIGKVPEDDLHDFTKGQFHDEAILESVRCGEFEGVGVDYVAGGKFWSKRWVYKGPLLLYVTYNSNAQDQSVESEAVDQMLATLRSRYPAA